jgi:ATP-dependent helicase/nuclease subunit B
MPRPSQKTNSDQPDLFAQTVVTRRFIGWEKPLVHAVAAHLAADWNGNGALDLSEWLVVVPTRNASRRLREALAVHAATQGAAVLPPLTVTPDFLTSPDRIADIQAAGQVETLLLWSAELLRIDLDDYRHLFPVDPVERNFTWALKTATDLLQVRETLNENGLSLADAARLLENSEMEPERWRDLANLENECVSATEANGFTDWQVARRRAATTGTLPVGVKRIVIAGVLDPSVLATRALERHARQIPVEVLIFAPVETHSHKFDLWGRPMPETWLSEPIHIPEPEGTIHQGSSPAEQAAATLDLLAGYSNPGAVAAIGIADVEISAPLEKTLSEHQIGAYDPAGKRMGTHGVFHLLHLLSQLCTSRSFGTAAELMRCPDVIETIRRKAEEQTGKRPSLPQLLKGLDDLAVTSLPDTLDDAIELAPHLKDGGVLLIGLEWMNSVLQNISGSNFGTELTDFLADVFAARRFRSDRPQDAVFAAIADQISQVLDALDGPAVSLFPKALSAGSRLELLLRVLEDQVFYPERAARDIDLQGWLELLWEDAPHLIVAGMNDGKVPESIMAHQFLPDSARRALGLRNNDTRFSRDACLMMIIIELRKRIGGRVDFIFGRVGGTGEPLRPSRLLFQCTDAELPERTLHFFKKPDLRSDPMPWRLAWQLLPQPLPDDSPLFQKLSVTQFRDYLTCPFRFYLKHGLKMREIDASRTEMDAMEFGNLLHSVLDQFSKEGESGTSTDASVIRAEFHRLLDRHLHGIFGARLTVPVTIQRESARQRLSWWADLEAQERAAGWRIIDSETPISPEGDAFELSDTIVKGIVDRVEHHEQFGVRLVDFKTYSPTAAGKGESKGVEDYHLTKLKRNESAADFPSWMLTSNSKGELCRWTDLQLPLYRLAMERRYPGTKVQTAYATLGKTKADIALDAWPDLEGELLQSARACAESIIAAIRSRTFWPPSKKLTFADDFGHLFFGDPVKAVNASLISTN